ncbi:MAG: PaaI family thioesterase [Alphaproteobacteria bacterium]
MEAAFGAAGHTEYQPPNPQFEARCRDSFGRQPFMQLIGATIEVLRPGYCEIHLPFRRELTQQHGFMHGGVLASIADSAAGYCAFGLMPADSSLLTVEYKLNIVRPGQGEKAIAKARIIKPGNSLFVVNSDVYMVKGGQESLVVTSIQTLMRLPGRADT